MAVWKDNPFSYWVATSEFLDHFQRPRIEPYDGSKDPEDHLNNFYIQMTLHAYGASDAIFCRSFFYTLKGPALRWFFSLPPNSISTYSQLTKKFLARFVSSKTCPKLPTTLTCLKQRGDESLEEYIDRFDEEARKVDDLSSRVYMVLIEAGLEQGSFKESLVKKPLRDLEDLRRRAARFVDEDDKHALTLHGFFKRIVLLCWI